MGVGEGVTWVFWSCLRCRGSLCVSPVVLARVVTNPAPFPFPSPGCFLSPVQRIIDYVGVRVDTYLPAIVTLLKQALSVPELGALACRAWLSLLRLTSDDVLASHLSSMVVSLFSVFSAPVEGENTSGSHSLGGSAGGGGGNAGSHGGGGSGGSGSGGECGAGSGGGGDPGRLGFAGYAAAPLGMDIDGDSGVAREAELSVGIELNDIQSSALEVLRFLFFDKGPVLASRMRDIPYVPALPVFRDIAEVRNGVHVCAHASACLVSSLPVWVRMRVHAYGIAVVPMLSFVVVLCGCGFFCPRAQAVQRSRDAASVASGSTSGAPSKHAFVPRLQQLKDLLGHDSDGVKNMALTEMLVVLQAKGCEVGLRLDALWVKRRCAALVHVFLAFGARVCDPWR